MKNNQALMLAYETGKQDERKRIIKLLTESTEEMCEGKHLHIIGGICKCDLIKLINKRKTND